jgi:hypothetical protein
MAEELKKKRATTKTQFTRTENSLRKTLDDESSLPSTIERKFEELRERWQTLQDAHDSYIEAEPSETDRDDEWINDLVERFDRIEAEADKRLENLRPNIEQVVEKHEEVSSNKAQFVEPNKIQLERLKLEKFNGEVRLYPHFKERFNLYIVPMCPKSQLPFVLRNHLEPAVRDEVDNVEDDMALLWARLDSKYGKYSRYVEVVMEDLAKTTKGDAKATLRLINTVEKAKRDLDRIGAGQEMNNSFIIAQIEKKFPDEMRFDWIKTVSSHNEENSAHRFNLLMSFLQRWRQMVEYDEAAIRKVVDKKSGVIHLADAKPNRKSENCWIHSESGAHPIWKCRVFQEKSIKERLEMVNQKKACHACLEVNCEGAEKPENCRRKFKCQVAGCTESHNVLLHA